VSFFVMLLLVLGLGDVLIPLHELGSCASFVEGELTGVLGTDRAHRQQALQVDAATRRACCRVAGPYELLELMSAGAALILVDRHDITVAFLDFNLKRISQRATLHDSSLLLVAPANIGPMNRPRPRGTGVADIADTSETGE
jgi:hypothetical protein